ncbi:MAG: hypothetical protein KBF12_10600 [Sebaldella sp.]|nr:hypothetical protein [Sebaldella sp.]
MASSTNSIYQILKAIDISFENQNFDFDNTLSLEKLKISKHRLNLLLNNLIDDGLIQGFLRSRALGQTMPSLKPLNPSLTSQGLMFLEENSAMKKAYSTLKELKEWIPGY